MFILILVAGLAALVVLVVILELYVQYRRKKLKELEQQKPEETVSFRPVKAEDMPEEITDLSHIKAYGKKIRRR